MHWKKRGQVFTRVGLLVKVKVVACSMSMSVKKLEIFLSNNHEIASYNSKLKYDWIKVVDVLLYDEGPVFASRDYTDHFRFRCCLRSMHGSWNVYNGKLSGLVVVPRAPSHAHVRRKYKQTLKDQSQVAPPSMNKHWQNHVQKCLFERRTCVIKRLVYCRLRIVKSNVSSVGHSFLGTLRSTTRQGRRRGL